jgi:Ca2+-binding EF-hand superfamily protein
MDSFIILQPKGGLVEGVEGSTLLDSPIKPTTVGLKMIDAPNGVAIGLAYRINGCNLERILVTEDEDSASSIKVVGSCILSGGAVGAVHLKASPDGRLVAVACIDGSLQCYDSTATSISLRWSIPSAHSHVTPSISSPVSADRSYAACGSGPILALDFSPYDYNLVLVDATKGMTIYDARVAEPINLIPSSQQQLTENVSSASWCGSIATKEECDGAAIPIAIGRFDGSIAILSCNPNSYPSDVLEPISELGCPSEEDGSVCTHLNWTSDTFVAGICRVFPPEDDEEPDEDDEDDNADHEACLYVTTIDDSLNRCADWMEQGDVVPFFTVPKFGRHVFFTSFLPHTGGKLIAVGTNVGTDIGAISSKNDSDGINDICWQPVEFQEGATATTPTNEDDEFAFPLGISILQLSSSSFRLLLAATDGSLSIFEYQHINDPKYFSSPVLGSTADLPSDPLVTMIKSSSATSNSISPPQTPENASWVVVDENKDDDLEKSVTPALSTTTESTIEGVPSANTTNSGLSGSGFKPSTFGSGNVSGLTFGSPNSGGSPFASFGKKVDETSVFGAVSSLSATASPITSTPVKPTNAFRSTGTFGSSTPSSIGGFAGLSSGGGAFGSSNTPSPGGSAFGSSPFNAFSKSLTPVSTVGGFPVKPLFGQASAPPTGTGEPTTVSVSSPSSKSLATTTDVQPVTPISFSSTKTSDLTATESPRKEDGISSSAKVEELSRTEKAAALVFDQFDSASSGSVPVSTFEDMSEALGEGFHGDEYDAQVNLVDPSKSGEISRSAFLTWYKSLVEGSDDDASLDSADQEERAEEEEKAKDAFGKLSKVEGGESYIIVDQFGDLFESMGSTYCEEEHKKTLKRLKKDTNRIYQSDFLVWYIDWLFGDEDSSDDDSDDEGTNIVSTNEGKDESLGLGSIFKIDVNSWRCDICSVRNNDNANQCVACETPRPGAEVVTANNTAKVDPGSSSSIGVGGFSFGETATTDTKTSAIGAGGFSFGGESNATSTSSSGGFKFGTTSNVTSDITKTSAPVSGFSFKSDAATPTKKVSASSSTFAALPPMPSKAPTPFGATKPAEKAPAGTFAALPPMSSKAPSPFGAKTPKPAQQAPTSTFAALPPMPSKAPTPSGAIKPVKKAPTSTFAALPPMSSKAPSPFGSKPSKPVEKAPTSTFAALPPMPNKAPTPFGGIKPVEKAPASTFAALPPMSSKAPSPFGAFGAKPSKPVEKAPASTFAALPPMSSKAPSPFGAFGAKPSKPVEKAPTSTFAALPPMSSKAPSPFGGAKISKPAEKAPASTFAALPPMSSKAPSPFGAKPSKPVEKVPSTFAALPPMSSKVPSPFGAKIPKPAEKAAVFTGKVASSQNATALVTTNSTLSGATIPQNSAGQTGKKKTKIQIQLDSVISSFSRTVAEVSQMRVEASLDDNELQQEIEDLATHIEQERSNILNLDDSIRKNRGETAFLLSRKTDSSRQIDEARKMIQEINLPNTGTESVVDTQGLDQESETKRRRFAASSRSIVRQMTLVRERVDLLEATSDDDHVYGKHKLLQGVMNLYKRSKYFEEVSSRIRGKINVASKIVPFNHRIKRVGTGRSTYGLESPSFKSPKHRNKLRPIPLESVEKVSKKQQQAKSSKSLASHWKDIESSLQQIGNENVKIDRFNTLTAKGATSNQQLRDRKKEVGVHKPMTHSLLMSPSASEKPSGNPRHENSLILSKRASMFSPPSKTKARNGWDQPSTIDQNRTKQLSLAAPRDLNQTTLSNASRETLASFGTTPEKLQAATEMKKKESTSSAEGQVHSSVGQTKRSVGAKAAFPPMSNKAPTNPFSNDKKRETVTSLPSKKNPTTKSNSSLSAPLPPMPKQAPKNPFSKDLTTKSKDTSSSTSIFALSAPKTSSEQQQNKIIEGKSLDSKKSEASSAAAFGSMNALGDSLLSSGSNKTGANPEPSFGAVQPISSSSNTTEAGKTNSYESILTSFYQKHNPTKIGEVKKTLEKFQGRESVLFEKLANKYKVPNPLEGTAKTAATGGSSALSGFGNLGSNSAPSAQPHSSGFGTTTGLASSPSPFASSSGTTSQQNPGVASSPFGSSASTSSSFGTTIGKNPTPTSNTGMFSSNPGGFQQAPAQSPFGSSTPSTNTSAFGISPSATNITAPSQSPFGGGNVASSSPFGAAATTTGGLSSASPFGGTTTPAPFGAPSPSPMQSNSQQMFNGRTARDLLLQFYQEKNPSKVAEVDKLLTKYRGNEEQMFRNLAKKYQLDCSVFGISSSAPNPGFGSPTVANPAFGQASAMGGGSSPFGQSPGGFGQPSSIGGGSGMSGSSPVGHSFGSGSTAGFGGSSNFGSLAQTSPSPFGGQSSNAPVFGSPPFGAARR